MTPILALLPSGMEWMWVLIVIVVLFGAKKLPELGRGLGRSLGEFKKGKEEIDRELEDARKTVVDTGSPSTSKKAELEPTKKS